MRIHIIITVLAYLKLCSCAEVQLKATKTLGLNNIGIDLIYEVSTYLDNPFSSLGSLNRYFKLVFSKNYSVKRIFNERFKIPGFETEDVDENEKELKRLLNYSKFSNPEHIYRAFRNEFLYSGVKFNALLPNLMKFFHRYNGNSVKLNFFDFNTLMEYKKIDYLFRYETPRIYSFISSILLDDQSIKEVQNYINANPQHIGNVLKVLKSMIDLNDIEYHIRRRGLLMKWIRIALVSNMPEMFYSELPDILVAVLSSKSFWIEALVPMDRYPVLFDKLNTLIDSHLTGQAKVFASLLNRIRFGPNILSLHECRIESEISNFSTADVNLMCHCASLANKKWLFAELIKDKRCTLLKNPCDIPRYLTSSYKVPNVPIEMQKLLFDIHDFLTSENDFDQFYDKTDFNQVLSKYCRIILVEWGDNSLRLVFKPPVESISYGLPERVFLNIPYTSTYGNFVFKIPFRMKFDNPSVFQEFLWHFLMLENCPINGDNLKLIVQSESLLQRLRVIYAVSNASINQPLFVVELKELLKVVDAPVVCLKNLVQLHNNSGNCALSEFKTSEQLQRLETLIGKSVSKLLQPQFDYFKYRHVFKYLVETGQALPDSIQDDTRALLKIEYPAINL